MYQNGFVVAVKINSKTVEEKDGKVMLPFDSEYSLMLKNRNDRKAVARVYIDGEEVTEQGKLIIDANGSINLERYIDDMNIGKRFKFVPITDNRVNDKGDSEKGYIEVRFQLVKPVLNNVVIHEEHYHRRHYYEPYWYYNGPYFIGHTTFPEHTVFYGNSITTTGKGSCATIGSNNFTLTSSACSAALNKAGIEPISKEIIQDNHLVEERGATIKGSNSNQRFSYSYVGELEAQETVIRFQLIGTTDSSIISKYYKTHCASCGKTYGVNDVFCSVCGVKR